MSSESDLAGHLYITACLSGGKQLAIAEKRREEDGVKKKEKKGEEREKSPPTSQLGILAIYVRR